MIINGNLSWERFIKAAAQANSFACEPFKYRCMSTGKVCELATEFGYCKLAACTKRYGDSPKDVFETEEA